MKPQFLNIDLDVCSRSNPRAFVEALPKNVFALYDGKHRGGYFVRLELNISDRASAETKLRSFCRILENLPAAAAEAWQKARSREFNVGLGSGDDGPPLALDISPETLSRVVQLNARIAITLYPQLEEDDSDVDPD